jgi:hypothetical protein
MQSLACFLFAYTAVALAFAAGARLLQRRPPSAARPLGPATGQTALLERLRSSLPRIRPVLFALAVAAVVAAFASWPSHDGAGLATVAVFLAVSLTSTGFVLLAPLVPRLVWGLAALAPGLAVLCLLAAR